MMKVFRWLAVLWGTLSLIGMAWISFSWFPVIAQPSANELGIAFMLFAFYGWPAWVALPVVLATQWQSISPAQRAITLAPLVGAVSLYLSARV